MLDVSKGILAPLRELIAPYQYLADNFGTGGLGVVGLQSYIPNRVFVGVPAISGNVFCNGIGGIDDSVSIRGYDVSPLGQAYISASSPASRLQQYLDGFESQLDPTTTTIVGLVSYTTVGNYAATQNLTRYSDVYITAANTATNIYYNAQCIPTRLDKYADTHSIDIISDWIIPTGVTWYIGDSTGRTQVRTSGYDVMAYLTCNSVWGYDRDRAKTLYPLTMVMALSLDKILNGLTLGNGGAQVSYTALPPSGIYYNPYTTFTSTRVMQQVGTSIPIITIGSYSGRGKNIYLHNYTDDDDVNVGNTGLTHWQTPFGTTPVYEYRPPRNGGVNAVYYTAYPTFDDIVAIGQDWGIILTDDPEIAANYPIDLIPGAPDVPDGYDTNPTIPSIPSYPDNSNDDFSPTPPTMPRTLGTRTTVLNGLNAEGLFNFLTTTDFTKNISVLFNDPLSAIISLKQYPFDILSHSPDYLSQVSPIKLVNVDIDGVIGYNMLDGYNCRFAGGTLDYVAYYGNYADYDNISYSLYLPYVGIINVPPSLVVNCHLDVSYYVNFTSGAAVCVVKSYESRRNPDGAYVNGQLVHIAECNIAQDVPIYSSNYNELQISNAITAINTGRNVLNGVVNGITNPATIPSSVINLLADGANSFFGQMPLQMSIEGNIGSNGGYYMPQVPYLIVTRQPLAIPSDYNPVIGSPASYYGKISTAVSSDGNNYCEIRNIKAQIGATAAEDNEIVSLLTSGIYL